MRHVELQRRDGDVVVAQGGDVGVVFGFAEGEDAAVPEVRPAARVLPLLVRVGPRPGALADDYFEIALRYGPLRYIASASCLVAETRPRFALHGARGSFLTFGVDPIEDGLRQGRLPGSPDFDAGLVKVRSLFVGADGTRREGLVDIARWQDFYAEVANAIRSDTPPPVDPRDARWGLSIIEAAHAGL